MSDDAILAALRQFDEPTKAAFLQLVKKMLPGVTGEETYQWLEAEIAKMEDAA